MRVSAETRFAVIPEWLLYGDVSDAAVRLYCVLARHADKDGRSHPSRGRIAELMRCSTKTVDRAMRELVALGAVETHKRFVRGGQTTNLFHIRTSDPATPVSLPLDSRGDATDAGPATPESNGSKAIELEVGVEVVRTAPASVLPTLATSSRTPDPIFEVLFQLAAGLPYSRENRRRLTKTAADGLNAAAGEIRATGISADELVAAIGAWPAVFPDATCTPQAVKKHLPTLLSASNGLVPRRSEFEETMAAVARRREAG